MADFEFTSEFLHRWLLDRHLSRWLAASLPLGRDDYVERMDRAWAGEPAPPYHLVAATRLLYSFSVGAMAGGGAAYVEAAQRMYRFLLARFPDEAAGGWFWAVGAAEPVDAGKRTYGQVFAILALSTHRQAGGPQEAVSLAERTGAVLRESAWDAEQGGYGRSFDRQWRSLEEGKRLNEQMHALEALLALHEVTGGRPAAAAIEELCDLTCSRLVADWGGIYEHFTADWQKADGAVWPGHQLEFGWLLLAAGRRLGVDRWTQAGARMIEWGWRNGWDDHFGGVFDEVDDRGDVRSAQKSWWPQCEAIVAALAMAPLTGQSFWRDRAEAAARWLLEHMEDKKLGGIFGHTDRRGQVLNDQKAGAWKAAYHVTQAFWMAGQMAQAGP